MDLGGLNTYQHYGLRSLNAAVVSNTSNRPQNDLGISSGLHTTTLSCSARVPKLTPTQHCADEEDEQEPKPAERAAAEAGSDEEDAAWHCTGSWRLPGEFNIP